MVSIWKPNKKSNLEKMQMEETLIKIERELAQSEA
jgi:hypothetical protein